MAELGRNKKIYLTKDLNATNLTVLKGETTHSWNLTAEALDTSDKTSKWKTYEYGSNTGTIDATFFADKADAAQSELLTGLMTGKKVFVLSGVVSEENAVTDGMVAECLVTSIGATEDNGAVSSRTVSLQINGEPKMLPA